jgi:hypothetical protein
MGSWCQKFSKPDSESQRDDPIKLGNLSAARVYPGSYFQVSHANLKETEHFRPKGRCQTALEGSVPQRGYQVSDAIEAVQKTAPLMTEV